MGEKLIKPYEISVWEDVLVTQGEGEEQYSYYEERKIADIGSDTMDGYDKVYDPVFKKKNNGEKTLTFSLRYEYFDPYIGATVTNPFARFLVNERKIKLHYDDKWYDFIIKEHSESSDGLEWTYEATDAFVLELSKNGYELEFDAELNNNQGTAEELTEKVLEHTDWQLRKPVNIGRQLVEEPIYQATLSNLSNNQIQIIDAKTRSTVTFEEGQEIFIFYSYIVNKDGKYVQFILKNSEDVYETDDKGNIIADNYRIITDLEFKEENGQKYFQFTNQGSSSNIITIGEINRQNHAYRLVYKQLTTYDPVMERTVNCYTVAGKEDKVYSYTDYKYSTSDIITNFVDNGENFNVFENGTLQGWSGDTEVEDTKKVEISLITNPELISGKTVAELAQLNQMEGFIKAKLPAFDPTTYKNTIFNGGFESNSYLIKSIAVDDELVFRWRAGVGGESPKDLVADTSLRCIIAGYPKRERVNGKFIYGIDTEQIFFEFDGTPTILNNIINNGTLIENNTKYVVDDVVQTPSTKYIYKNSTDSDDSAGYVWSVDDQQFVERTESNYLNYYYLRGKAKQAIPNTVFSDPTRRIGIFIYTTDSNEEHVHYLQDIQITRYIPDGDSEQPIVLGNIPIAQSVATTYYYEQPEVGTKAEEINTYASLKALADTIHIDEKYIKPEYNEDSEKILSIKESQSNCFNILQTIAETFECWIDLEVEREDDGRIKIIDGVPQKFVALKEYVGKDNWAGFKYGINLDSIERTINSEEITTKLIVSQTQSDHTDSGVVTIADAKSNLSGESYILNFDYYYQQGLLDKESTQNDLAKFEAEVKSLNNEIAEKQKKQNDLANSLLKIESERNVYVNLIETAQTNVNQGLADFEKLCGKSYEDYQASGVKLGDDYRLTEDTTVDRNKTYYTYSRGYVSRIVLNHTINYNGPHTNTITGETWIPKWSYAIVPNEYYVSFNLALTECFYENEYKYNDHHIDFDYTQDKKVDLEYATVEYYTESKRLYITPKEKRKLRYVKARYIFVTASTELQTLIPVNVTGSPKKLRLYEVVPAYTDNDTFYKIVGKLYVNSTEINNYSGILTNINEEYIRIRKELKGDETFYIDVSTAIDALNQRWVRISVSDYLAPLSITLGESIYPVDVNTIYFEEQSSATELTFNITNDLYEIDSFEGSPITVPINDDGVSKYTLRPKQIENRGYERVVEDLIQQKKDYVNKFFNKYSRYILEGTWESTDYIDPELYYLDALQVSNTSAQPQVTYTIKVIEISEIEGFELYKFDVGDKTYVEDTEFFGWSYVHGALTPAREEVIVSEVEWHLEEPNQNTITVQNYKTRFEDLFQRISATVQTVQYNEATYAKITSLLDADGTLNQNVLLQSMNNLSGAEYNLTSDGSIMINGSEILVRNLTNASNLVKINNEGIKISSDGGNNWSTAIDGRGINIGTVYTGMLNTDSIIIGNNNSPSFRWDSSGISAYKLTSTVSETSGETIPIYDLKTFVRFDQYGLYGIKNNQGFIAASLDEIKDQAHFAVTWDGFFIKNSYPGGGRVEITSDNDFRVMNIPEGQVNEQEKIKIGALEWGKDGQDNPIISPDAPGATYAPTLYGIRIKNDDGDTVMKTGDDGNLEITGTIYAGAGEIGGVIIDSNKLKMNHIILEPGVGIYSDYGVQTGQTNYPFIISDVSGKATFRDIEALGGLLSNLLVKDTITVGDSSNSGLIKSQNYTAGASGWAIKSDGIAEFQNAIVRGEVNAGSGNFYGAVTIGKDEADSSKPYIEIDGLNSLIKSSNYQDGAGYGWMINKDGDAVFNNITARGAIKTAVFEYAEIQAVGGIFIFRPSSTIKSARVSGNDLVLEVEKPALFAKLQSQEYSWCKISNYTTDGSEPDVQNTLLTNGLTHVYKISNVDLATREVTLANGAQFISAVIQSGQITDDVLDALSGGALVDMGREDQSSNYGIGVNSSDNTVNLPRRAISLFETVVDPTKNPKISYNYRGILGTLPTLPNTEVYDAIYNQRMAGTQGIYTDNMYIGDKSQYIAFYEDEDGKKKLKISAKEIIYEVNDDTGEETTWEDYIDDQIPIKVDVTSSAGNMFLRNDIHSTLTCTVYKGTTDITNEVTSFIWQKKDKDGNIDGSWSRITGGRTITIGPDDVDAKAIFICKVEF